MADNLVRNMKRHDTGPTLRAQIISDATSQPVDLSGAAARFIMVAVDGTVLVDAPASIDPGVDGTLNYLWQPGDTAVTGSHLGEFQITYPTGLKETYPSDETFIEIRITEDLDDA